MKNLRGTTLIALIVLGLVGVSVAVLLIVVISGNATKANLNGSGAAPTFSAGAATVSNAGFEDGLTGWVAGHVLRDGVIPNEGYTVDTSNSMAHSGKASAYIQPAILDPKQPPRKAGNISTKIPADVFRGKRVRYTAYLRTEDEVAAGLWMQVIGMIDGKPTDPDIPMSWDDMVPGRTVSGTTDWHQYDIVLDVPQEADFLLIGAEAGYGQMWIDDVHLDVVGPEVALTDKAPMKQTHNLDFEQGLNSWETETVNIGQTDIGTGSAMAHSGKLGAYIRQSGGVVGGGASLNYPIVYGQYYRDKKLQLSAYMNVDKAPRGASVFLWAYYLNSDGKETGPVTATAHLLPTQSGAKGWQRVEATIDVPDRTWGITFGAALNGDGEVWIDDMKLDVLGPAQSQ